MGKTERKKDHWLDFVMKQSLVTWEWEISIEWGDRCHFAVGGVNENIKGKPTNIHYSQHVDSGKRPAT